MHPGWTSRGRLEVVKFPAESPASPKFGMAALLSALALGTAPTYSPTPFGLVLAHCVHEVPSGALVDALPDGTRVVSAPDGTHTVLQPCDTNGGEWPIWRASEEGKGGRESAEPNPLPPDYDGWLQYTALNVSELGLTGGFDSFTSVMSVPDAPARRAHILYFFPGLQNRDWIPKIDPLPTPDDPFDILQPVLEYPGDGFFSSGTWTLKSWYVTVNGGALFSRPVNHIKPGDAILCNMTRTGPQSWKVSGALRSDPSKVAVQEASNARLKLQPWAYSAVAECYGCHGCSTYPTKPITFTENKLYQGGREIAVPPGAWKINPKPQPDQMCNESTTVAPNGDATISFQ